MTAKWLFVSLSRDIMDYHQKAITTNSLTSKKQWSLLVDKSWTLLQARHYQYITIVPCA